MIAYIAIADFEVELEYADGACPRDKAVVVMRGDPVRAVVRCCSSGLTVEGIRAGARVADVRRRFPGAVVLQERASFYESCSRRITLDLAERVPVLEKAGLASWLVDLSGCDRLLSHDFHGWAGRTGKFLKQQWGVTASIGFASNRMTAEFACKLARTGYAVLLLPWSEKELIGNAPLELLPGLSRRTCDFLNDKRLHWAWELKELGRDRLRHWLGSRDGNLVWEVIHGQCIEPVKPLRLSPLLSQNFTFERGTSSIDDVAQAGIFLMGNLLHDAEQQRGFLRKIMGEILYTDDHSCRRQVHVPAAVMASDYYNAVTRMIKNALTRRVQVRSLTLSCPVDFEPAQQGDFFSEKERVKRLNLEQAMADIRDKYGYKFLYPASGAPRPASIKKKHFRGR